MAQSTKEVSIAVIGAGGVGSVFLQQLAYVTNNRPSQIPLVYVAIIDKAIYHADYKHINIATALSTLEDKGAPLPSIPQTIEYLSGAPGKVIVVDNTSSQQVAEACPQFLRRGTSVVIPNKKGFSGSWKLCTAHHRTFEEWSDEVKKAKQLGYTEPNPCDDLNGLDVARKVTIVARLSGLPMESPTSFPVQSLVLKDLEGVKSGEDFLERLSDYNTQTGAHKAAAENEGRAVRYIGYVDM
ncbi:hypothetical protein FSARC_14567, partial [Fusarium sarcochroum]